MAPPRRQAIQRCIRTVRDAWLRRRRETELPLGERGERAAARYLKRIGCTIVARGFRKQVGELDIVAIDGRTVVFVEVKTRTSAQTDHPAEAVDGIKQQRLTRTALSYLRRHHLLECAARFDVIAITWPEDVREPLIEHFKNAFEPTGQWQIFD